MKALKRNTALFFTGGAVYSMIEIAARGYTHWSMTILGGVCLVMINIIDRRFCRISIWSRCALGAAVISVLEFIVGCIVNLLLGWNVWDYSRVPMNLLGQVCLPYSAAWFLLCLPAIWICRVMHKKVFVQ